MAPELEPRLCDVQRNELLALGLERLVADLSAAEFIPAGRDNPMPVFNGTEFVDPVRANCAWPQYARRS